MKRRLPVLVVALTLSLGVVACGDDDDKKSDNTGTTPAETTNGTTPETTPETTPSAPTDTRKVPIQTEEVVKQCLEGVEASGLTGKAKEAALKRCEELGARGGE